MIVNNNTITKNDLLSLFSQEDQERTVASIELVTLKLKEVICEPGEKLKYVYFPISGMLSLVYILENGNPCEVGIIGKEGFVGVPIILGGDTVPYQVIVQGEGEALRTSVKFLANLFNESNYARNILLRYLQAFITQISQTAVCNIHHPIDKRLCRWILLSLDRVPQNELVMTQDLIATMLGVRREGVAVAAKKLQDEGLIKYSRGKIFVLDRERIENKCCECYEIVDKEFSRLKLKK